MHKGVCVRGGVCGGVVGSVCVKESERQRASFTVMNVCVSGVHICDCIFIRFVELYVLACMYQECHIPSDSSLSSVRSG